MSIYQLYGSAASSRGTLSLVVGSYASRPGAAPYLILTSSELPFCIHAQQLTVAPSVYSAALSTVNFRSTGQFVNLARIGFDDIKIRTVPNAAYRYHLSLPDHRPAICVSPVMCTYSQILRPATRGVVQKFLNGVFHTQEWERTVGFICTAFGHNDLHAQLSKDAMQFATRAKPKPEGGDQSGSQQSDIDLTVMFSNTQSPSTVHSDSSAYVPINSDNFTLDWDAEGEHYPILLAPPI
ncbi:hypothetical protein NMY22_g18340 [Coprinellus aureogranulatus]|nr:hypothetical protein NMY22_g18340 [Coprinellus aureogranulatus]